IKDEKKTDSTQKIKSGELIKVPVHDGKGEIVYVNKPDSVKKEIKADTIVNANKIAEKFKGDKKTGGGNSSAHGNNTTTQANEVKGPATKPEEKTTGIIFKVQVASSDQPLDLKQEKYSVLSDPTFYKVNNSLKYTSGNFTKFKTAVIHQNILRQKGFADCFVVAFKNGERIDLNEAKKISAQ
ncbi:MAG: hypothetical protein HYZ42_06080, partial [Bacteroidetes bacterium]|nr:hypothetical protein [Bacteroidota bacterium]